MKMKLDWELVALITLLFSFTSSSNLNLPPHVMRPPTITKQPEEEVYAVWKSSLDLPCAAQALPEVNVTSGYEWMKDGEVLVFVTQDQSDVQPGTAVMSSTDGSITFWKIDDFSENDLSQFEGVYQCFASNVFGTAMSREVKVKVAYAPTGRRGENVVDVEEGKSLNISCEVKSQYASEVTWHFSKAGVDPGDVVGLSNRISQSPDGSLIFSNVVYETDDQLKVFCNAKNPASRVSADDIDYVINVLRVDGPVPNAAPQILVPSENLEKTVLLGSKLELKCVATGMPTPSLSWKPLSGDGTRFADSGNTAVINKVSFRDAGQYRCSVSDQPSIMKVVEIDVEALPYFESDHKGPMDVIRAPGEDVTIRCQPQGVPKPEVEWRINGKPLNDADENPDRVVRDDFIRISNLKKTDTAVYQCKATNKHGSIIQQGFLNVIEMAPVARSGNVPNQAEVEQKSLRFKCHIFASPAPVITWSKDGKDIVTSERFNISENGHIQIHNLVRSDEGNYRCKGENRLGNVTIDFSVKVFNRTTLYVKPKATIVRGKPIALNARVDKDFGISQKGEIVWSKLGKEIGRGNTFTKSSAEFNDEGTYKAQVYTNYDTAFSYVKLFVIDRPAPPENFRFRVINSLFEIEFIWNPGYDYGSEITKYEIEFEENTYEPGKWKLLLGSIAGDSNSVKFLLPPGLNYTFRAFAHNSVGRSANSSAVTRRYKTPDAPPNVPQQLTAAGTAPKIINVSWKPVSVLKRSGPGFGYNLSFKASDSANEEWEFAELPADSMDYVISGEKPYQEYVIELTTFNNEGTSLEETLHTSSHTGEDTPESPPLNVTVITDDASPKSAIVRWNKVDEKSVRGKLLGYKVFYSVDDFENEITVTNATKTNITDLEVHTVYKFQVVAYNSAGESPRSPVVTEQTPRGIPNPGKIKVVLDETDANITWTPADQSVSSPPHSVRFEYRKNFANQWSIFFSHTDTGEEITATIALEPDEKYSFRVVTTNIYGPATTDEVTVTGPSGPDLSTGGVTSQIWFIVIMCLIGILVIVLLLVCFIRRSKGGKYPVAEKEQHRHENQPFADEEAGGYNDENDDVRKPLAEGNSNGKSTGGPARTRGDSVGGDSIEEFVGADPKEFNEDGSFIGQYGIIASPSDGNTPATPTDEKQIIGNGRGEPV